MLSMMLPTGLDDVVEVLMSEHYACSVEHVENDGPPGPHETYVLRDMEGFLLRKFGTHRPSALMFWVTPGVDSTCTLPQEPLVGVRLYVPRLHLKLPLLPDLGFDDLREIDLPQPILRLEYLHAETHPDWLATKPNGFAGWSGHGPVPASLRDRFPDL
jgi:hypothetical protein